MEARDEELDPPGQLQSQQHLHCCAMPANYEAVVGLATTYCAGHPLQLARTPPGSESTQNCGIMLQFLKGHDKLK